MYIIYRMAKNTSHNIKKLKIVFFLSLDFKVKKDGKFVYKKKLFEQEKKILETKIGQKRLRVREREWLEWINEINHKISKVSHWKLPIQKKGELSNWLLHISVKVNAGKR